MRWVLLWLLGCPSVDGETSDSDAADEEDVDGDGWTVDEGDCDDEDASVHPGATETCNGVDDDCDDLVDDADEAVSDRDPYYADADGDGYGDENASVQFACVQPTGTSTTNDDCDDASADIHPDAIEDDCTDPTDYNCDGSTGYEDVDGDGYAACEDCDDADEAVTTGDTYYADSDGDDYGDPDSTTEACSLPDGYVENAEDCDDADYDTNPDAEEECEDGIDNDCDDLTDDADLTRWYEDEDGDGYGNTSGGRIQCEAPSGYVADNTDCDDEDADVNPDAEETWYDGVDQDCDEANDYDQDGDGYESSDYDGEDCDDLDADVSPDGTEALDGADQDCDDVIDEMAVEDVAAYLLSGSGSTAFGAWVDVGGDVDGDGNSDLIGSTQSGRHSLFSGPITADATVGDAVSLTASSTATLGKAVIVPDVNGDGYDDVLVGNQYGASYAGAAYLLEGPITSTVSYTGAADYTIEGDSVQTYLGTAVAGGDLNGDGYGDLVVSALGGSAQYGGSVYAFLGPITADLDSSEADAYVQGSSLYEYLGYSMDVVEDLDGDGLQDVVAGARLSSYGATYAGAAYAFFGPVTAWSTDSEDADTIVFSETAYAYAGHVVRGAGDVTDDGYGDFLVASVTQGSVWVASGSLTGSTSLDDVQAEISGATGSLGTALAAGDFNGDGTADVVVTAPYAASSSGKAWLVTGPLTGEIDVDDHPSLVGDAEQLGTGADLGDINGDGYDDLLLGASANDENGPNVGAMWVITGRSW